MPIIRISGRLIYFAHVPRSGGTSLELYMAARFGPLALRVGDYLDRPPAERWTRTAPQHVSAADLARLFPADFFDDSFALVRHPVARLASVFRFQRDVEGRIGKGKSFEAWLEQLPDQQARHPYLFDNHTRPMADMVPQGARIFRLEAGMDKVIAWLDDLAGATAPDLVLKEKNNYAKRVAWAGIEPGPAPEVTDRVIDMVTTRYEADFDRFGYAPDRAWEQG